jgi:TonB-dependent SusC/RagA subfamily outer membrane receptor
LLNQIETLPFFKDAQAIYGTIGANGVILITTKQVKNSKPRISFILYRFSGNNKIAWLVDATEYALLLKLCKRRSVPFSNVTDLERTN